MFDRCCMTMMLSQSGFGTLRLDGTCEGAMYSGRIGGNVGNAGVAGVSVL
jgi:hypothetical protein